MIEIKDFQFNMFGVNTYVVWDSDSREAMIVDPGMVSDVEMAALGRFIDAGELRVKYIVNTHMHLDHIFGLEAARKAYGVNPMAHKSDIPLGEGLQSQLRMFGMPESLGSAPQSIEPLPGRLMLGGTVINVIEVPGHSPGGVAFYCPSAGWVITGDSLFAGSIGRTDLPGGSHGELVSAVRSRLLTLPDDTVVYPGHGPATTIGVERHNNPYL